MITNKVRENIRKQFNDFNLQFKSINYPTTKMITAEKDLIYKQSTVEK